MIRNNIYNLRNLQRFLFTDEEMNPRNNADRDEVLATFGPMADGIVAKMLEAGDCYLAIAEQHPVARQEHTFLSSTLHGLIIEYLTQLEGVKRSLIGKRNSFLEIGSYKVWVKKLDERNLPWVNDTKSSVKRVNQKADGEDVLPVLILGYQLDYSERMSKIQLIYIEGDQHLWAPIDLGDMAANNQVMPMVVPAVAELDVKVKPEKKRSKENVAI
jgi:hypothetical protein